VLMPGPGGRFSDDRASRSVMRLSQNLKIAVLCSDSVKHITSARCAERYFTICDRALDILRISVTGMTQQSKSLFFPTLPKASNRFRDRAASGSGA
jgi:hypothetical protein